MQRIAGWILVLSLVTSGCAGPGAVAPNSDGPTELRLKVGDNVRLVTKYRERLTLKITEIQPTGLIGTTLKPRTRETQRAGENVRVAYGDLALLELLRASTARKAATVGAVAVISVIGLFVLATPVAMMPVPP